MADLSKYSDEQLQGMLKSPEPQSSDLSKYTNEQLAQMLNDQAPANERPTVTPNEGSHPTYGAPAQSPFMSTITRQFMRNSPIEASRTNDVDFGNSESYPKPMPGENMFQFINRVKQYQQPREQEIANKGTMSQLELPIEAGLAISGASAPLQTVKALGKFMALDTATNAVGLNPDKIKDPNLRDVAQVGKFGIEGGLSAKRWLPEKSLNDVISNHADMFRKILNPNKSIINSTNIDLDNATSTLAKKGIIIDTDVNNKLDNSKGIQQLQDANKPLFQQAQEILQSKPDATFDLNDIASQAKANLNKYIKNGEQRMQAKGQIDNAVKAEISENGDNPVVDAQKLYLIKQGMYERAYKPLEPTANDGARAIGSTIKTIIEKAFPEHSIMELNQEIGNNLEAQTLLEKTNGNIVQAGKLGQHFAGLGGKITGGIVGGGVGLATGHPFIAAAAGAEAGGLSGAALSKYFNDPTRITTAMAKKVGELHAKYPPESIRSSTVTPEVMNTPPGRGFSLNPFESLPNNSKQPLGIPNMFSDRGATPPPNDAIKMGNTESGPVIEGNRPDQPYSPGPEAISSGKEPAKPTPEAKQEAKDKINSMWYEKMTGQKLPLGKTALAGATALGVGAFGSNANAMSKLPKVKEGQVFTGEASTYGWGEKGLNPTRADNKPFNPKEVFVAMSAAPLGTIVEITDNKTGKKIEAPVADFGPGKRTGRVIDLSQGAWRALGYNKSGLTDVTVKIKKVGSGRNYKGKY